jgi:glycosyltransferase involved in cell wall biosynthesis
LERYALIATVVRHDATTTLFFDHLAARVPLRFYERAIRNRANPLTTVRSEVKAAVPLAGATALVVVRGLFEFRSLAATARRAGIPCYYFVDDNFMVLRDEPQFVAAPHAAAYALDRVRAALRGFSGVWCATPSLIEYFRERRLHDALHYYPPVAGPSAPAKSGSDSAVTNVAFFGGEHRREPFMGYVFPALCRLAASRPVTLFAVGIDLEGVAAAPQLTVTPVAYNRSYPEALRDLAARDVDILVHPSSDTLNNLYKNPHFLINARAVGATPIFSDVAPYNTLMSEDVCVLCENTEDAWFVALNRVAGDASLRSALRDKLATYCEQHFDGSANLRLLEGVLSTHEAPTAIARTARVVPMAAGLAWGLAREAAASRNR